MWIFYEDISRHEQSWLQYSVKLEDVVSCCLPIQYLTPLREVLVEVMEFQLTKTPWDPARLHLAKVSKKSLLFQILSKLKYCISEQVKCKPENKPCVFIYKILKDTPLRF